ncbi:hypothetical protein HOLleu_38776 [Holothuria leucospilota]|uniref:VWFD domain-containing protein n=1 Tax=Holothuria leucospilota TaxID=206669 RepID=A0A9Q0YJY9_HOLLE|nr:hypothetical protein HOLleu_38776 [Holothuria leucospilota]
MFNQKGLPLLMVTVIMVTKSALAQTTLPPPCYEYPKYDSLFQDCGPLDNPDDYDMCCLRGDPHITTFDLLKYSYVGREGWFTAVIPCDENNNTLQIDVYLSPRFNKKQFRATGLRIMKNGTTYEFKWNTKVKTLEVTHANGNVTNEELEYNDPHLAAWIMPPNANPLYSHKLIIRCKHVKIVINCKFHMVYIYLLKDWSAVMPPCGLCGCLNAVPADDTDCVKNCRSDYDTEDNDCSDNDPNCEIPDFGNLWMVKQGNTPVGRKRK